MSNGVPAHPVPREVKIKVHDGVNIAVAIYMPESEAVPGSARAFALSL